MAAPVSQRYPRFAPSLETSVAKETNRRERLVYSSEHGPSCLRCGRRIAGCACREAPRSDPGDGVVRVGRETQGRRGKGVTVIRGVSLPPAALAALARELKQRCGTGGTVKSGAIEIQGDHRDALMRELANRGWKVKRSGG